MAYKPIENCYWVVPDKLLAGEYPIDLDQATSRAKMNDLIDAGVAAFIDLTEENEIARGNPLRSYEDLLRSTCHQRFPIRDGCIPETPHDTVAILDTIDRHLDEGRTVYVHCWGGIGRTGTVVGCWLARHGYLGQAALDRLTELWQTCPKSAWAPTPEHGKQENYVRNWSG